MSIRHSFITKAINPCITCVNYINYKYETHYDEIYERENKIGTCSLFGKENLVTGEIKYEDALACRINESKCGKEGKYFKN